MNFCEWIFWRTAEAGIAILLLLAIGLITAGILTMRHSDG